MSDYRKDPIQRLLINLNRHDQADDDTSNDIQTAIQDIFVPLNEQLALSDSATVTSYSPATFCWGDGKTIDAGWEWNVGGKWNA